MKPTVLHISPTLVPMDRDAGGVANVVRQLAINQAGSGNVDVMILCPDTQLRKILQIDLGKFSSVGVSRVVVPQSKYEFAGPFWPVKRFLNSIIQQRRGNLVAHIHTCFSSITDMTARYLATNQIPFLLMPHGKTTHFFRENKKYEKLLWLKYASLNCSIEASGSIGCFSQHEVNETINYFRLQSHIPTYFAPNGFPSIQKSDVLSCKDPSTERLHILYLGYLDPRKNIINLLRAFKLLKKSSNAILTIAGPDAYSHEKLLRREVQRLAIAEEVNFLERVDGLEKVKLYQSASVLVLPSSGEGQPLVLGEALAVGLPIIFSKHCNFSFAAQLGAGIELPTVDPVDIAKAIHCLWRDKKKYFAMKDAAFRLAEKYSWSATSNYWMTCYSNMLSTVGR